MRKIYILLAFVGFLFINNSSAQDIHFTQFYMSPLNLNPAMTGVMNCNTRLVANYRNQWAGVLQGDAYNTYSVSYDQKVAVGRTDYFGIGGSFWGDVAGASRFGSTQGRMSLSYSKKVAGYRKKASYIVFGADLGVTQRRVRQGDLRWPNQHDGNGGFNAALPSNEIFSDQDFLFADLSAGLLYFSVMERDNTFWAGMSAHHLNQPNVSHLGDPDQRLYSRYTFHAGGTFELKKGLSAVPGALFMTQGPHREYNIGSALRFALGNSRVVTQSWQLGVWYRFGNKVEGGLHSDAFIFATRLDYEYYGLGFSYDYNISGLSQAGSANGAFEFSLNYYICGPEKRSVYCPRF